MKKFEFDYDKENDDLFLYDKKFKSSASVEIDDLVVDFNRTKGMVGIEIMNATRFLGNLVTGYKITKKNLSGLMACEIDAKVVNNLLFLKMVLVFTEDRKIPINLSVPRITKSSPALAAF